MKFKIEFVGWLGKAALDIDAGSVKEAVEKAAKDGADLRCADLEGADLHYADLHCANLENADLRCANLENAKYRNKRLWAYRPVLQLGPCGHVGRTTVVFFFADGSDPLIRCGCFTGTLAEFREKIRETHKGTFHELEYNALASHIEAVFQIQKGEAQSTRTTP